MLKELLNGLYRTVFSGNKPSSQPVRPYSPYPSTTPSRIAGNVNHSTANDEYNFSPFFNNVIAATQPESIRGSSLNGEGMYYGDRAAGEYYPNRGRASMERPGVIVLNRNQNRPDTVRHEGLHAVYQRKNEAAKKAFLGMASSEISPEIRQRIQEQLGGDLYGLDGTLPQDLSQLPANLATEVHSYLPDFARGKMSPRLAQYYSNYFNPSAKQANGYQIGRQAGVKQHQLRAAYNAIFGTPEEGDY